MTTFHLKLIAVVTMVIDHIGVFFFPHILILRIIGRLSMPLFAWLIANGVHHTRDRRNYLIRLLVFGLLSQMPFILINRQINPQFYRLNILFGLAIGLAAVLLLMKVRNIPTRIGIVLLAAWAGYILQLDYGPVAVLMVIISYYSYRNMIQMVMLSALLVFAYYTAPIALEVYRDPYTQVGAVALFEPVCLISYAAIAFYNGKEGPKSGYALYLFYPAHMLLMYFLKLL